MNTKGPAFVQMATIVAVTSSQLLSVAYDAPTRTLQIDFKDNPDRRYQYHDVPPEIFEAFIEQQRKVDAGEKGASVGHVFYDQVKGRGGAPNYHFTRFVREGDAWAVDKTTPPQEEPQAA